MIDTHCHLLPGLDDGPASDADSIELARRLSEQGVETVVCTPHVSRRYRLAVETVRARLDRLRAELETLGVPLRLHSAGEVSTGLALEGDPEALVSWRVGSEHLVVDVERDAEAQFFELVAGRLRPVGLTPIFAHPERSARIRRDPRILDDVRAGGSLVQVVAPSLAGSSGSDVGRTAWGLLEQGRVDLLGTDSHRAAGALKLRGVLGLIEERLGAETVERLTVDCPARVVGASRG